MTNKFYTEIKERYPDGWRRPDMCPYCHCVDISFVQCSDGHTIFSCNGCHQSISGDSPMEVMNKTIEEEKK